MSQVVVPDIGDFKEVEVIEVLVKPGDAVSKEQSLITLESDKATMEIPSPAAGVVKELKVKMGDKVSQGTPILELDAEEKPKGGEKRTEQKPKTEASSDVTVPVPDIGDFKVPVPDIGDFKEVEVIEVLVKPGDTVSKEQSLITLESDKATMEIPSPAAGVVKEIRVKIGDKVAKDRPRVRCRASRWRKRRPSLMPARRCASSRASSASIWRGCAAAGRKAASCMPTCRPS